ncbi:MAG: CopG family ribbon-helix-helix protein [Rhizobiaceae bacterium]
MPSKAETFSVRLSDTVKSQVDELARLSKRSRSYIVQEAIASYVQDRAAYLREIDEAVLSAEIGVAHSGEQIFGWMKSWGTEGEMPSPEPDIGPDVISSN